MITYKLHSHCRLIKNGFDVTKTEHFGIRAYAGWCLTAVLGIVPDEDVLATDKILKQNQLHYIIHNMSLIYQGCNSIDILWMPPNLTFIIF